MRPFVIGLVSFAAILAGCASGAASATPTVAIPSTSTPLATQIPAVTPGTASETNTASTQTDSQGAITIEITPVDLAASGVTFAFDVSLNTHSVDLSMDLAAAATLIADTGRSVAALAWDAPKGGHHVSGKLIFPALVDGTPLLEGASQLTLILTGIDAPERRFAWGLPF